MLRGDQFIRRWQVIRPMGASPEGLIVVEVIGHRPGTEIPTDEKRSKSLLHELQWLELGHGISPEEGEEVFAQ